MRSESSIEKMGSNISVRKKRKRNVKNKMDRGSEIKMIVTCIIVMAIMIPLFIFLIEKLSSIFE